MKSKYFLPIFLFIFCGFAFFIACNDANDSKLLPTQTTLETRSNDCYVNTPLPPGCTDSTKTKSIVINGCTFNVVYTIRKCATGFTISNMGYTYGSGTACDVFRLFIDSLFVAGNYTAASTNLNQLYSELMSQLESYELGFYSIPNCNSGFSITTNIIAASCLQLCRFEREGQYYIKEEICGAGCCTRFSYYCKDDNGKINRQNTYGPTPVCDAGNGVCDGLLSSECTVNCSRIIPK